MWGHAIGGMGAITQAMARAAGEHGVRIDVGSEVREVIVEGDRAAGVVLKDGTARASARRRRQCQSANALPGPCAAGCGAARRCPNA